jgi:hypothetical protein
VSSCERGRRTIDPQHDRINGASVARRDADLAPGKTGKLTLNLPKYLPAALRRAGHYKDGMAINLLSRPDGAPLLREVLGRPWLVAKTSRCETRCVQRSLAMLDSRSKARALYGVDVY